MDQDTGRSVQKRFEMPRYSHPDYCGNEIEKDIEQFISRIYFVFYEQNQDFLNNSRCHFNEDTFYVLFLFEQNYKMMNRLFWNSKIFEKNDKDIVKLSKSGRLKLISLEGLSGQHCFSLPIIIEMYRLTRMINVKEMIVKSQDENLIRSAKFIFKRQFDIDVRIDSQSISEPENTNFLFRNNLAHILNFMIK